jgi:hypothetical protein
MALDRIGITAHLRDPASPAFQAILAYRFPCLAPGPSLNL